MSGEAAGAVKAAIEAAGQVGEPAGAATRAASQALAEAAPEMRTTGRAGAQQAAEGARGGGPDGSVGHRTRRAATNRLRGPAAAGAAAAMISAYVSETNSIAAAMTRPASLRVDHAAQVPIADVALQLLDEVHAVVVLTGRLAWSPGLAPGSASSARAGAGPRKSRSGGW